MGWGKLQVTRKLPTKAGTLHVLQPALPLSKPPLPGWPDWKGQFGLGALGRFGGNNHAGRMRTPMLMQGAARLGAAHAGKARPSQAWPLAGALTPSLNEGLAPALSRGDDTCVLGQQKREEKRKTRVRLHDN